ncbi:MAG TPA: DUF2231 domain-containing protein [Candidatus Binataceae bacterium]|nr:DUF2231 domain-containing protein [Candidatus Binataceae bacterium]
MDAIVAFLQRLDLHPVVDHFTVGLLIVGVLIDIVASAAPTRTWLRYMALTLMILGAIAAGASYFSGDIEADRLFKSFGDAMTPAAKGVFHWHAMLGEYMAIAFGVLALWRILIQAVGSFAGSRPVYLLAAIVACAVLLYIGSLGGKLVYTFGWGTPLLQEPSAPPTATPVTNETLPSVTVPTPVAPMPTTTSTPAIVTPPPSLPTATPTPQPTA